MASTQAKFQAEEQLLWVTMEHETPTRRMVEFQSYEVGMQRAIVTWNHNAEGRAQRHSVLVSELHRPPVGGAPPPWFLGEWIKPYAPPTPPSIAKLEERLTAQRSALAQAQDAVLRLRDGVTSATELVGRAAAEFEAARGQLLMEEARLRSNALKLERALRQGKTPPEPTPSEVDRSTVIQRVNACETALSKFQGEERAAHARLGEAHAAVRTAALQVLALTLELEVEALRAYEDHCQVLRANLQRVSQHWYGGVSAGPLKISEVASSYLVTPPDPDKLRFLGAYNISASWQALYDRLLSDPNADFDTEQPAASQAAE